MIIAHKGALVNVNSRIFEDFVFKNAENMQIM